MFQDQTSDLLLCSFFSRYGDHRDLHNSEHSFPTRRSSDLFRRSQHLPAGEGAVAAPDAALAGSPARSEEHTSELQSLAVISYAVFCWKKKIPQPPLHSAPRVSSTLWKNSLFPAGSSEAS